MYFTFILDFTLSKTMVSTLFIYFQLTFNYFLYILRLTSCLNFYTTVYKETYNLLYLFPSNFLSCSKRFSVPLPRKLFPTLTPVKSSMIFLKIVSKRNFLSLPKKIINSYT